MDFRCIKNIEHKFTVEKPKEMEGIWHWRGIVHCPYDGTDDIEEVLMVAGFAPKRDLGKARTENREATAMAQRMAGEARAREEKENPNVTLTPIQGASSYGRSAPVVVKKKLLDSIAAKTPDSAFTGAKE